MGCMRTSYDGLTDLHAIYRIIKENHPGLYNEEDPTFTTHLESAYHAHAMLLNNQPQKEQQTIITNFIKTFNDNHLGVSWRNTQTTKTVHTQKLFSITEIAPRTLWITLPTFYNLSTEQSECFNTIIHTLSTATTGHTIIFDIRTN
jgi:hypothetical protein